MHHPSASPYLPDGLALRLAAESGTLAGSGGRLVHPAETVRRVWPLARAMGVTRLARTTNLDDVGIPVWLAVRPNAANLSVSQGKGLDDDSARASALMEAVELAVAEAPDPGASAVDRRPVGAEADPLPSLLLPGAAEMPWDGPWVAGVDVLTGATRWFPLEAVMLDYTTAPGARRYWQSTDGLASGNCMAEAVVHGLLERIERDALALWSFRTRRTVAESRLSEDALVGTAAEGLRQAFLRVGHAVTLYDLTTDIGVPVIAAAVVDRDAGTRTPRHFEITVGSGCHPDPVKAAIRALTEAAQSRVTVISGARDDFPPDDYRSSAPEGALDYLLPAPSVRRKLPAPCTAYSPATLAATVASRAGPVSAVPLADRAEFCVAKVIVPGLENPSGARRQRWGRRVVAAMLRRGLEDRE